jgi:hypothetical protein
MSNNGSELTVYLPDGAKKTLAVGSTAYHLAESISQSLKKKAVGAVIDKELICTAL